MNGKQLYYPYIRSAVERHAHLCENGKKRKRGMMHMKDEAARGTGTKGMARDIMMKKIKKKKPVR